MIFYRIKRGDTTVDWERTQADARANAKHRNENAHHDAFQWTQEDVPTDSHGLHAWLKANALGEKKAKP